MGYRPMTSSDNAFIDFTCRRCFTPLKASKSEVGTERRCHKCQLVMTVPRESRPQRACGEYSLANGAETSPTAGQRYVSVVCPLCSTRMYAAEDQIGRRLECPECGTDVQVTRPKQPKRPKKIAPVTPAEGYALRESGEGSSVEPQRQPKYFPVYCTLCNTLMHATEDQVGLEISCPDCNTRTIVPAPLRKVARKPNLTDGVVEGYAVGEPIETPEYEVGKDYRLEGTKADAASESGETMGIGGPSSMAVRGRWPMVVGVFGWPFFSAIWMRWLGLTLGLFPALVLAMAVLFLVSGPGAWHGYALFVVTASAAAMFFAVCWAAVMAVDFLTVLRDTSYGCDKIEESSSEGFIDWIGEAFYVLNALAISMLLSLAIEQVLVALSRPGGFFVLLGPWQVFPIVLLSMLETNSPLNPFSPAVLRSLLGARWLWAMFYLETALLLAGFWFLSTALCAAPLLAFFVVPGLLVALLMIYARLLGRLVWCCSGRSSAQRRE